MIHFGNDYHRSSHPRVLEAIAEAGGAYAGYGADELCATAAERIRTACQAPNAEVHFMVGGTQANATIIAHQLRPWEGVIAADSGHIATHETGAIEHTGHKVITLPNQLGKITAAQVRACMEEYRASGVEEHMPEPALVYITQPTEFGTAYSRAELVALREVCDEYELGLFVDGARLGYGLSASDITLPDLAALVDVFNHRRHQMRRPLRRGHRLPRGRAALSQCNEAKRRPPGQGLAARRAIRRALQRPTYYLRRRGNDPLRADLRPRQLSSSAHRRGIPRRRHRHAL